MSAVDVRRFPIGAAVLGKGWLLRVWRLRVIWAPCPDPTITRVVADEDLISEGEPQTYTIRFNYDANVVPNTERKP